MDENENQNQEPQERKKVIKRKVRWGRVIGMLIFAGLFLTGIFWSTVWIHDTFFNKPAVKVAVAEPGMEKDEKLNERINVLLLGIDDGDSEAAKTEPKRTDAMLLFSFDPGKNKVSLLSIPRDTKITITGHRDPQKINAAYTFGGVVGAKQAVANLLHVPVHYYALANWQAFIDMVDMIGGVDINVEKDMHYEDPYANLVIDIKKGPQHMDGKTAGKYVRFRSDELGDIGRVQRQQQFMKAAFRQMFSMENVTKIGTILKSLDKYIQTDMDRLTMLKAAKSFNIFGDEKMQSCMLYGQFEDTPSASYWKVTKASVNRSLDELEIPRIHEEEQEKAAPAKSSEPIKHLQPEKKDDPAKKSSKNNNTQTKQAATAKKSN